MPMITPKPRAATTDPLTDEQVVARVLAGDVALFEVLMRRHNARVYRAVRALIRNEADVEDAMQAAYLRAYAKLASFRGSARFSTWLTQIAVNEALGRLRRDRRHPAISLTVVEEPSMSSSAPPSRTPETDVTRRELVSLLEAAIDTLPEPYRIVFVLREVEGMDTAETAETLTLTEDVVKTRLFRARALLRGTLEQRVGSAASEAFGFRGSRCDRIVAVVMGAIATSSER